MQAERSEASSTFESRKGHPFVSVVQAMYTRWQQNSARGDDG